MTGIILMGIGVVAFVSGAALYRQSPKATAENSFQMQMDQAIQVAIADGVLTENERIQLRSMATDFGMEPDSIISSAEELIAEQNIDSETEIIDVNKKSGDDFEKFIVKKFPKKYFIVKEWAGDKYVDGIFAETTTNPDILLELQTKFDTAFVSVECKWRREFKSGSVQFAYDAQLKRYQAYEKDKGIPVFIALGIGGKPDQPDQLFVLPVKDLDGPKIKLKDLLSFEKKVESTFFFDAKTGRLK